jgi:methyl-accepting chemotaxis protein
MDQPSPDSSSSITTPGLLGRRRQFFFNRPHQLRATLLTAGAVIVLLVILNLVLYSISVSGANRVLSDSPELAQLVKSQARLQLMLILLASVVFLAGVFFVGVIESHRTAGVAAKLSRHMGTVEKGRYNIQLQLRREDHLQEVQTAFNQMTRALRDRTWHELETLERVADQARHVATGEDAGKVADELLELAHRMRRSVD